MDPSIHGEIDELILDFLIYTATEAQLKDAKLAIADSPTSLINRRDAHLPMKMVDCKHSQ